jgi:histidine ammonia-lyase
MHVLAIELYSAARALDLRMRDLPGARMGQGTEEVYNQIRKRVPYRPGDAWWGPEIDRVHQMITQRALKIDTHTLSRYI